MECSEGLSPPSQEAALALSMATIQKPSVYMRPASSVKDMCEVPKPGSNAQRRTVLSPEWNTSCFIALFRTLRSMMTYI